MFDNMENHVEEQKKDIELIAENSISNDGVTQIPSNKSILQKDENINLNEYMEKHVFGDDVPNYNFESTESPDNQLFEETWESLEQVEDELEQDDIPRFGIVRKIITDFTPKEKYPILCWLIDVKEEEDIKHIKMKYIFSSNKNFLYFEFKRLQETLKAFRVDTTCIGSKTAENIADKCQYLVGTKVKIVQTRENNYVRYKIIDTERSKYERG